MIILNLNLDNPVGIVMQNTDLIQFMTNFSRLQIDKIWVEQNVTMVNN